jgi:aspartate kinase
MNVPLVVQKFGGSSVADAGKVKAAARRSIEAYRQGAQVVVVVSACGDATDDLIKLARQVTERPPARELDMLLSTGEQVSVALMAMAIEAMGVPAISFTGAQIGIVTDSFHTKARIRNISTERIFQALEEGKIVIVAGFQGGRSERGHHDAGPRRIRYDRRGPGGGARGRCVRNLYRC